MGKGFIYVSISGFIWILSGFIVHIVLGRALGPKSYGTFGIINAILSGCYLILGSGLKKAVTKHIAGEPDRAGAIRKTGFWLQSALSVLLAAGVWVSADYLSSWLNDPSLLSLLHCAAFIIPLGGILHLYCGYFDGRREFGRSAAIAITNSILKVLFVCVLLAAGYQILGAVFGLLVGMAGAVILAIYLGRGIRPDGRYPRSKLIQFAVPAVIFSLSTAVLNSVDLFLVKSLLADANKTGYYASAQTIARLVNFAMVPFGIILLPTISVSMARNDLDRVRHTIRYSLRYLLIAIILVVTDLGVCAKPLIQLIYGELFVPAAFSLSILFLGTAGLGLTNAIVAIIQGSGAPRVPAIIFVTLIPINIVLNLIFIPRLDITGAALASSLTFLGGLIASILFLYERFSVFIGIRTLFNVMLSAGILALVLTKFPVTPAQLPIMLILGSIIYFISLWLLKEINEQDLRFVKNTVQSIFDRKS